MTFVTDPIGDLLARLRNAQMVRKSSCVIPHSRLKLALCEVLKREDWIKDVEVIGEKPKQEIRVTFFTDKPQLTLKRISRPGRRYYLKSSELRPVLNGFGIAIVTTSEGLLTDQEARKRKLGGEVLCTVS